MRLSYPAQKRAVRCVCGQGPPRVSPVIHLHLVERCPSSRPPLARSWPALPIQTEKFQTGHSRVTSAFARCHAGEGGSLAARVSVRCATWMSQMMSQHPRPSIIQWETQREHIEVQRWYLWHRWHRGMRMLGTGARVGGGGGGRMVAKFANICQYVRWPSHCPLLCSAVSVPGAAASDVGGTDAHVCVSVGVAHILWAVVSVRSDTRCVGPQMFTQPGGSHVRGAYKGMYASRPTPARSSSSRGTKRTRSPGTGPMSGGPER